jgi:hypothetical protein
LYGCLLLLIISLLTMLGCWLWNRYWNGDMGPITLGIIFAIVAFISLIAAIVNPIVAKQEVTEFNYTKQMVIETVDKGSNEQNYAVTNTVIEMNKWLADARASKDFYGIFSAYYLLDLDSIDPIIIN